nr:MAG TPA: hypothetical protein [Caudoviricetes sp.]
MLRIILIRVSFGVRLLRIEKLSYLRIVLNNVKRAEKSVDFLSICDFFCKCALTGDFLKKCEFCKMY